MRKLYILLLLCFFTLTVSAQDSQGKFPIYVLPQAMTDDGSTDLDMSKFCGLVNNTKAEINQYAKSYAANNLNDATYVVGVFIDGYEPTSKTVHDQNYNTITDYSIKVTYTLAISPADQPEKIISKVGPYPASYSSFKSYDDALATIMRTYPEHGRIRELLESALSVDGEITKVVAEAKHADRADHVWVNVGKDHGILDTQWFDVYTLDAEGNRSDKAIGSLHAVEVGANSTECNVKKGEKEIMAAYNAGTKMVVESREENNIWKKAGRVLDKTRVLF